MTISERLAEISETARAHATYASKMEFACRTQKILAADDYNFDDVVAWYEELEAWKEIRRRNHNKSILAFHLLRNRNFMQGVPGSYGYNIP